MSEEAVTPKKAVNLKPMGEDLIIDWIPQEKIGEFHDPTSDRPKNLEKAVIIRVGDRVNDPDLKPGVIIAFVPHGGTIMPGSDRRMVLPADQVRGLWTEGKDAAG